VSPFAFPQFSLLKQFCDLRFLDSIRHIAINLYLKDIVLKTHILVFNICEMLAYLFSTKKDNRTTDI